ncbi:MAG: hypothetical protein C3F06_01765 [Candidatus Methanoperedenaceae archaeon]|nr:MAG: hypothetical protein C3F06_01765 [Candidatus Methanoperedenaceae archaeon]
MVNISLITLHSGGSALIGVIGFYLVIKIWKKWQHIDIDLIKARVFLNRNFLVKNWQYTFLTGASQAAHQFLDFIVSLGYLTGSSFVGHISSILEFMVLIFLVVLAYEWYKMIYSKNEKKNIPNA